MYDKVSKKRRSEIMTAVKSRNTKPEIIVRKFLFSKGFRFRLHDKKLPGKPDVILKKYKTVIFINGCFWHGHENCKIYVMPKSNTIFWSTKIEKNILRDQKNINDLNKLRWNVITVWECQLRFYKREDTFDNLVKNILYN